MKTARINYIGADELEYTEIRPVRPNQSVVLAGLGVTGSRLAACRKDRGYRSSQGAGWSDGLVIHSSCGAGRGGRSRPTSQPVTPVTPRLHLYQDTELYSPPPPRPTSVSPPRAPRSAAGAYELFDQHLQNILERAGAGSVDSAGLSRSTPATPGTARYREAACQTPTHHLRLSPLIPGRLGGSEQEAGQRNPSSCAAAPALSDDELDLIGDFMVKESLGVAAASLDNSDMVRGPAIILGEIMMIFHTNLNI